MSIPLILAREIEYNSRVELYGLHYKPFPMSCILLEYMKSKVEDETGEYICTTCGDMPILNEDGAPIDNENDTHIYNG